MTARGWRGVTGELAARGTVQETLTRRVPGLGCGVRPNGRRSSSAFLYGGLAACRRGQRGLTRDVVRAHVLPALHFGLALFDRLLLKIFQHKWTKRPTAKL
jgi:hypothetical protein